MRGCLVVLFLLLTACGAEIHEEPEGAPSASHETEEGRAERAERQGHVWVYYATANSYRCVAHGHTIELRWGRWRERFDQEGHPTGPGVLIEYTGPEPHRAGR